MWAKIIKSIAGWFDSEDLTKDVKLLAYVAVVVFSIIKLTNSKIDDNWVHVYYGLCLLVGAGGTAWTAVETWRGKNPLKEKDQGEDT